MDANATPAWDREGRGVRYDKVEKDLARAEAEIRYLSRILHEICSRHLGRNIIRVSIENTLCRVDAAYPPEKE